MSKNEFKLISFAEINRQRDSRDELPLSQGDKVWLKSELKQIAYVLDLTKQELISLAFVLAENSSTKPAGYPSDEELLEDYEEQHSLKEKTNAIQERSTQKVDAQKPTANSEQVGEGGKVEVEVDEKTAEKVKEPKEDLVTSNAETRDFVESVAHEDVSNGLPAKKKSPAKKKAVKKKTAVKKTPTKDAK